MKQKKIWIILFWLFIWQLLSIIVNNSILLSGPIETSAAFILLLKKWSFWQVTGYSLLRIGTGFFAGAFIALLLAGFSARFSLLEEFLAPLITLLKTVPVASFVVLLLIWWGSSFLAVAVCFLVVLPNIYINTLEGIKNTDKRLLEMAEIFRLPFINRFFYIYRPALRPFIFGSMKVSLGMCWKAGVAAEVIGISAFSIGEQLYLSKISLDTAGVLAWTAVVILLSIGFEKLALYLTGRFFAWEPECRKAAEGDLYPAPDIKEKDKEVPGNQSLRCTELSKSFQEQTVWNHFSAEYFPGNIYYLTQPSGSGKTTLLRLLCGLEKPDEGTVSGVKNFSVMFQEDRLCEEYSAVRNVELITGDRKQAKDALLRLLEEDALDKPCSQLSGGMKRRVALVRAMEAESEAVFLDEPFTGMDEEARTAAMQYIEKKRGDRIVILAAHVC